MTVFTIATCVYIQCILAYPGLTLEQIYMYDCDETGLYYQLLPKKTLAGTCKTDKEAPGMKKQKEYI